MHSHWQEEGHVAFNKFSRDVNIDNDRSVDSGDNRRSKCALQSTTIAVKRCVQYRTMLNCTKIMQIGSDFSKIKQSNVVGPVFGPPCIYSGRSRAMLNIRLDLLGS